MFGLGKWEAGKLTASGNTWQRSGSESQWRARQLYMHDLAHTDPFLHLLGGLNIRVGDLVIFATNHRSTLREISLDNIQAVDSTFAPFLARVCTIIKCVHLKELQENLALVHYRKEQESQCTRVIALRCSEPHLENPIIELWGDDVRHQVEYFTRDRRRVGIEESFNADKEKRIKFGSTYAGMPGPRA